MNQVMEHTRDSSFCRRFEQAWAEPTPERLASLLTGDVVLYQPQLPPIRGKAAVIAEFTRLLKWLPGTHSVTTRWQENAKEAFIEHTLHFPAGRDFIRLPAVDVFRLENGLARERIVYFDQVKLITGVLKHPSLWPGFIRYRLGR